MIVLVDRDLDKSTWIACHTILGNFDRRMHHHMLFEGRMWIHFLIKNEKLCVQAIWLATPTAKDAGKAQAAQAIFKAWRNLKGQKEAAHLEQLV